MEFKAKKIKKEYPAMKKLKEVTGKVVNKAKDFKGRLASKRQQTSTQHQLLKISSASDMVAPESNPKATVLQQKINALRQSQGLRGIKSTLAVVGVVFVLYCTVSLYSFIQNLKFDFSVTNIINTVFGQDLDRDLSGKKTNLLLLGVGGGAHDGADLSDSIMVASYDYDKKTLSLLSIPRDLYVKVLPGYYERINAAYDILTRRLGKEEGIKATEGLMKDITGLDVQYYAKINFNGFRDIVDILGGVEVNVPETLVDPDYPVEDKNGVFLRNEVFKIEKGLQHMDGETALRYARSRHSTSDFDRANRQRLVMSAIKDKALKTNYLTDTNALKRLYYAVSVNLETDLTNINQVIRGASIAKDLDQEHIVSAGLNDDSTKLGGFLYTPDRTLTNGASVLLPNGATPGNLSYYTEIRRFMDILTNDQQMLMEKARIRILNATKVSGLGKSLSDRLSRYGFTIADVSNTKDRVLSPTTKLYVLTEGRFQSTLDLLQTFVLSEPVLKGAAMEEGVSIQESLPDIEIVIGQDYARYMPKY